MSSSSLNFSNPSITDSSQTTLTPTDPLTELEPSPSRSISPLPPVDLPRLPTPTLARSTSTTHIRGSSAARTPGLDLSVAYSSSPTRKGQSLSSPGSITTMATMDSGRQGQEYEWGKDAGASLEEEVARTRQARATRQNASPTSDPRDTASARENIIALAGRSTATPAGTAPSLASFMGGGAKPPPLHRVGTGPTEDEREVTDRLEREMEATKARWGNKSEDFETAPRGPSLASLLSGKSSPTKATSFPTYQDKAPAATASWPPPASTNTHSPSLDITSRTPYTTSPSSSFVDESTATSRTSTTSDQPRSLAAMMGSKTSGPRLNQPASQPTPEPRSTRVAMPGMTGLVRERTKSLVGEPAEIESVVGVPRHAAQTSAPKVEEAPRQWKSSSSPIALTSPRMAPTNSLSRLQSSNIVSQRLKWGEEQAAGAETASPDIIKPSTPKRNSLMSRWPRDEPDSAPPTSPISKPVESSTRGLFGLESETAEPKSSGKLEDLNRNRARPKKSTPRTLPPPPSEAAQEVRADPSPRFDSPAMLGSSFDAPSPDEPAPTRTWSGPPIAVKEGGRKPVTYVEEQPTPKYTQGVALPGMVRPSLVPEPALPAPAPAPVSRPVSIIQKKTSTSDLYGGVPRSPGGSVKGAIAMWGSPARSASADAAARAASIKESYGVKVSSTPARLPTSAPSPVPASIAAPAPTSNPVPEPEPELAPAPAPVKIAKTETSYRLRPDDVHRLLRQQPHVITLKSGPTTSVEFFDLGSPSSPVASLRGVLYDTETLGVVRSTASGKEVLGWAGKNSSAPKWTSALGEIAARYHVIPISVSQGHETDEVLQLFGSRVVIRRGARSDFDPYDSRLYIVRRVGKEVVIEEGDIAAKSLCSAFCAVASLSGDVYVWKGAFSTPSEREVAEKYGKELADGRKVTVVDEGHEPEHLWYALGGTDYASANYWRFVQVVPLDPLVIRIDSAALVRLEPPLIPSDSVSVFDSNVEIFVIVPKGVTARRDLLLALEVAEEMGRQWRQRSLAYRPPVHVLRLPSSLPRDLLHLSRKVAFDRLHGYAPHLPLDILTIEEARSQ